jgi:hypothetical protein
MIGRVGGATRSIGISSNEVERWSFMLVATCFSASSLVICCQASSGSSSRKVARSIGFIFSTIAVIWPFGRLCSSTKE